MVKKGQRKMLLGQDHKVRRVLKRHCDRYLTVTMKNARGVGGEVTIQEIVWESKENTGGVRGNSRGSATYGRGKSKQTATFQETKKKGGTVKTAQRYFRTGGATLPRTPRIKAEKKELGNPVKDRWVRWAHRNRLGSAHLGTNRHVWKRGGSWTGSSRN